MKQSGDAGRTVRKAVAKKASKGKPRGRNGRFEPQRGPAAAQTAGVPAGEAADGKAGKRLKPAQCRGYLRRELASSFPDIVQGFVKQARSGSVQHLKLTTELLEKRATARRGKGSAQRLWEDLQRMNRPADAEGEGLDAKDEAAKDEAQGHWEAWPD